MLKGLLETHGWEKGGQGSREPCKGEGLEFMTLRRGGYSHRSQIMIFVMKRRLWLLKRENRCKGGGSECVAPRIDIKVKYRHRARVTKSRTAAVGMREDGVGEYFGGIKTCKFNEVCACKCVRVSECVCMCG